jgi:hypothetical protein
MAESGSDVLFAQDIESKPVSDCGIPGGGGKPQKGPATMRSSGWPTVGHRDILRIYPRKRERLFNIRNEKNG